MKRNLIALLLIALTAASCGNARKDEAGDLNDKKAQLQKLKGEQKKLSEEITKLETDIGKLDTTASTGKPVLVTVEPVTPDSFTHYIDLQGKIDATNIAYVAPPNGQGGVVKALYVKQGDNVRRGQVLARLDDQMIRQQIEPLRVQLAAAEDTYKRTKNLFDQGIGTYQQVLTAETQAATLRRQIGIVQQQAALMTVTAPSSGVADVVNVRVGELFVGATQAGPQIRIVNTGTLKVTAEVPENYLGKVGVGSRLQVAFPGSARVLNARVNVAGKVIDPNKRSFLIEAPVSSDPLLRPNQIVVVKIQDYANTNAVTVPLNTIQTDESGKFVMVAVKEGGKLLARKRNVVTGQLYNDRMEVKSGLLAGDAVVTEGYQSLYEGQLLTTDVNAS